MSSFVPDSNQIASYLVFLSHAGEDKETIGRPLYERLRQYNVSAFFDVKSFQLGDHSPNVMEHAMNTAHVGVFIMSPEFVSKEWCMRELLAFVRRRDNAEAHRGIPPLLIPVFYRLSTRECRDEAIFVKYADLFRRNGLFKRAMDGLVSLENIKHALHTAATVWGIENNSGASNSLHPNMVATRKAFIQVVLELILERIAASPPQPEAEEYEPQPPPLAVVLNKSSKPEIDECEPRPLPDPLIPSPTHPTQVLKESSEPKRHTKDSQLTVNQTAVPMHRPSLLPCALFRLAKDYEKRGHLPDAIDLYRSAALQGHLSAMVSYGLHLVTSDERAAFVWFRSAAVRGHPRAWTELGLLFARGSYFEINPIDAARCWRRAALLGDLSGRSAVALCYIRGFGVKQNLERGLEILRHVADVHNHSIAMKNLGWLYRHGKGVTKNTYEAEYWENRAIKQAVVTDCTKDNARCLLPI